MTEILRLLSDRNIPINELNLNPEYVAELIELYSNDVISSKIAKEIFIEVVENNTSPQLIVKRDGLVQVSDTGLIEEIVIKLISENPDNVEKYKSGKTSLLGFFVGQTIKLSEGKANPKVVTDIIKRYLEQ